MDRPWLSGPVGPVEPDGMPTDDPPRRLEPGGPDTSIFGSMPSRMGWKVEDDE